MIFSAIGGNQGSGCGRRDKGRASAPGRRGAQEGEGREVERKSAGRTGARRPRGRRSGVLFALALAGLQPDPAVFSGLAWAELVRAGVVAADERLAAYRWSGQGTIPWPFAEPPARLHFGAPGRTPSTLLLLGFEGPLTQELGAQDPRWSAGTLAGGVAAADGRLGAGLALARGTALDLGCADTAAPGALTLELWLRVEDDEDGPILALPGVLALAREGGRLRMSVAGCARSLTSAAPLVPGRWSHVGLVVDGADLAVARLVLDGRPVGADLAHAGALAAPRVLALGGGPALRLDELRLSARAANTAELMEASEARARPLEVLELTTDRGTRALEVWTRFATTAVLDDPAGWAGGELERVVPGEHGLAWVPGHWRRIRALDPPLARTCHPTVRVGDGQLLVFSGEVRDSHLPPMRNVADTWLFHAREERWERLATALAPPGRCHQQAAFSPDHGLLLMAIGWSNGPGEDLLRDDTWVFHVGERRWEPREPGGSPLKRGYERALVYHPRLARFLLFNGQRVAAYDPAADRWSTARYPVVDEEGQPLELDVPSGQTAGVDPESGAVVLFGGQHDAATFSDLTLLFEPQHARFVRLEPPQAPAPRVRPGFAYDSRRRRFVLFGGVRDQFSVRMDDLWTFDPAGRRWTRQEASSTPSRRGGYMHMAYEPGLDRFFLLCGRHDPERFLEESWSLALDERAPGRARFAFDRGADVAGEWFHAGETPGASELRFRFRTSVDGLAWGDWGPEAPRTARYCEVEATFVPDAHGARPVLRALGFRAGR